MKKINLMLLMCTSILLVGCGTKNVPTAVAPTGDTEVVVDADMEVNGTGKGLIDTLKERNEELDEAGQLGDEPIYIMNTGASTITWKADRVLSAGHVGTVGIKEGLAVYNNNMLQSATATIDMTTITSDSGDGLNKHLVSEDFFDVANYPEATIVITSVESMTDVEKGDYTMAMAALTIKGITNPVSFPIYKEGSADVATITIDRTLWDVKYGSDKFFDDLADKAIKDEITFDVNITYVQ